MAHLYLLRHAKSDWGAGLSDHERPLNGRGRAAATLMGHYLADQGISPELILCSTATRTKETLVLLLDAAGIASKVQFDPALYGADFATILDIVHRDAGDASSVLLVGHNPGFHDTAMALGGTGEAETLRALQWKYPTCTLCDISFKAATLATIEPGEGTIERFVRPKDLV